MRSTTIGLVAILVGGFCVTAANAQDKKPAADPADRQVFFGEHHMHTRNSFDAFTAGVNQTWEQACRFAMGEDVALSTTGQKMKTDPGAAGPAVQKLIQTLVQNNPMKEYVTPEQRVGNWQKFIAQMDVAGLARVRFSKATPKVWRLWLRH
jgi:hypothetical protein